MAEFPALPLWTDAYLGDTTHLTTTEHGAYLLLLMAMWRNGGSLPDDEKLLARYARLTSGQWGRMAATIRAFFRVENGSITQGRLTDELVAVKRNSTKQSDNSKARWLKTNKTVDAKPKSGISHGNASLPISISSKKEEQDAGAKIDVSQPVENPDSWNPDRLLFEVMGAVGLKSGRIPTHWMPPASTMHVWRWVTDLKLEPEAVVDAARLSRQQHPEAPNGPKALDGAMRRLASEMSAPPMQPDPASQTQPIRKIRAQLPSEQTQ